MDVQDMSDEQLTQHVGRMHNAKVQADKAFEEAKAEWYRRHGKDAGAAHGSGPVEVYLTPVRRWDEATARAALAEILTPAAIAGLETAVIDRKKAEKHLPPIWYEKCQKDYGTRFNVRIS